MVWYGMVLVLVWYSMVLICISLPMDTSAMQWYCYAMVSVLELVWYGIDIGIVLACISFPMHTIAMHWYAMVLVLVLLCNGMVWYGIGIDIGMV